MLRIFDFQCLNNHVFEAFVDSECRETECTECDTKAKRIVSAVKSVLDPISGTFPGATMKWARHRQKTIQHERRNAE